MARGFDRPPRWAVAVMVVGVLLIAVVGYYAAHRSNADLLSPAEQSQIAARLSTAKASASAAAPKRVLFLGDSYTAGTGASAPANRWTALVSQAQHWLENNRAYGGTGYVASLSGAQAQGGCAQATCPDYDQALTLIPKAFSPQIIVVSGGRNDVPFVDTTYGQQVAAFYQDLHKRFPAARILAVSPIWDDDPPPAKMATIAQAVQSGVTAVGGTYLDIGEPLTGNRDDVIADGIHPNDAGHKAIADAVNQALTTASVR